jgi:hypothetical protein
MGELCIFRGGASPQIVGAYSFFRPKGTSPRGSSDIYHLTKYTTFYCYLYNVFMFCGPNKFSELPYFGPDEDPIYLKQYQNVFEGRFIH